MNKDLYLLSINPMGSRVEAIFEGRHRGESGKPGMKISKGVKSVKGVKSGNSPKTTAVAVRKPLDAYFLNWPPEENKMFTYHQLYTESNLVER